MPEQVRISEEKAQNLKIGDNIQLMNEGALLAEYQVLSIEETEGTKDVYIIKVERSGP